MARPPYNPVPQVAATGPVPDYLSENASAASFGGLPAAAEQKLGGSLTESGDTLVQSALRISDFNNTQAVREANQGFMKDLSTKYAQFSTLEGQAANAALPQFQQSVEDTINKTADGLQSPMAKSDFLNVARFMSTRVLMGSASYAAQQQKKSWIETNASSIDNLAQFGVLNQNDPKMLTVGENNVISAARDNAGHMGMAPEDAKDYVSKNLGKYYRPIIESQALTNPALASATFARVRDKMDAVSQVEIERSLRGATDTSLANGAVQRAFNGPPAGPVPDMITHQATTAGISVVHALTVAKLESGIGTAPDAPGNTHTGVFQLGPDEWKNAGGKPEERGDQAAQVRVGVNGLKQAGPVTDAALGRPSQPWEQYLTWQQGAAGGPALIKAPVTQNVVDALAPAYNGDRTKAAQAVTDNGGRVTMTAGDFTGMWRAKYQDAEASITGSPMPNTAAPPPSADTEAAVVQRLTDDPALQANPVAQERAIEMVQRRFAIERSVKTEASQNAGNQFITQMLKNPLQMSTDDIANNKDLTGEQKWNLSRMLLEAQNGTRGDKQATEYGPGIYKYLQMVTPQPAAFDADPRNQLGQEETAAPEAMAPQITDPTQLWDKVPSGELTIAGVQKLSQIMQESRKGPDAAAVNATTSSMLAYAKSHLSFEEDSGFGPRIRDPKGEDLFNAQFIPQFMQQLSAAKQTGDAAAINRVLSKTNIDSMIQGMRPQAQMARDRLVATGNTAPQPVERPGTPIPPAPAGFNADEWSSIMSAPPVAAQTGQPFTHAAWAEVLRRMEADKQWGVHDFDEMFGPAGYSGAEILERLHRPPSRTPDLTGVPWGQPWPVPWGQP